MIEDRNKSAESEHFPNPPFRFGVSDFERLLVWAKEIGASDLLIKSDEEPIIKNRGRWQRVVQRPLAPNEVSDFANHMAGATATSVAKSQQPVDFTHSITVGRGVVYNYRGNITGLAGGSDKVGIFIRTFPGLPPKLHELGLPPGVIESAFPSQGLVIISGKTGSGKTTLLASLMQEALTTEPPRHIVSYESPLEFDLRRIPDPVGTVSPSSIPEDVKTWAGAVKNSLRQAPDIILVGEARDRETIEGANTAAQTGHSVYTTTHTNNVHGSLSRMADAFPDGERSTIMLNLVDNVRLIVHQRLVAGVDGQRVALREFLAFDEPMRMELMETERLLIPAKIRRWVLEAGQSLMDDAIRNRAQLDPAAFLALEREFALEAQRFERNGGADA